MMGFAAYHGSDGFGIWAHPDCVRTALESGWRRYYRRRPDGAIHKTAVNVSALSGSHRLRGGLAQGPRAPVRKRSKPFRAETPQERSDEEARFA